MLSELMNRTFTAELTEGEHNATLTNWEYKPHATDHSKDYIVMTFSAENCGKTQDFVRNMFERDISIMISHLRRQLNRANEDINPTTFFDELKTAKTPIKFWIAYPIVATKTGPQRRQNIYFLAPTSITSDEAIAGDMELPNGVSV